MVPVDVSANITDNGATPLVGLAVKLALIAGQYVGLDETRPRGVSSSWSQMVLSGVAVDQQFETADRLEVDMLKALVDMKTSQ
jgi:hypothetical protein